MRVIERSSAFKPDYKREASRLSAGHYGSGAFTVLAQMSEILARYAQASLRAKKEVASMLGSIINFGYNATKGSLLY